MSNFVVNPLPFPSILFREQEIDHFCFSVTLAIDPGDFVMKMKLLCLHFNLRSVYFQSLQSLPNWIQLDTS